jgi:hypothetical protein
MYYLIGDWSAVLVCVRSVVGVVGVVGVRARQQKWRETKKSHIPTSHLFLHLLKPAIYGKYLATCTCTLSHTCFFVASQRTLSHTCHIISTLVLWILK